MKRFRFPLQWKFLLAITAITFPFVCGLFIWIGLVQENQAMEQIKKQAQVLSRQVVLTRQWVADNGGVLVDRAGRDVERNSHFYDHRVQTADGMYQLFTPAMVTKSLSDYSFRQDLYKFRLVSLTPMNPENYPKGFEKKALERFEREKLAEASEMAAQGGGYHYRYLVPLVMKPSCLSCHGDLLSEGAVGGGLSVTLPADRIRSDLIQIRYRLVTAGACLFLLLTFTLFFLLRKIVLNPILSIEEAASRISRGDLSARVDIRTGDEFETLGKTFNDMARQTARGRGFLEKRIRQATVDLSEANRELKTLDKLKSDFMANMSHELRSPLTALRGGIDYLKRTVQQEDDQRYLNIIDKNLNRLITLVTHFFDFTRLEAKAVEWSFETSDISALIGETIEIVSPIADGKHIRIRYMPAGPIQVRMDVERMEQVLVNLIDNAVKFSPEGGMIRVKVTNGPGNETVTVSVKDEGIGISAGNMAHVFEKFHFLPNDRLQKGQRGAGLGLAICKKIIEAHQGIIRAESVAGGGSTFFFTIPALANTETALS